MSGFCWTRSISKKGTVCVEGEEYPMKDLNFPTIDWEHPYELSSEEEDVMERITQAFLNCENYSVTSVSCSHRAACTRSTTGTCSTTAVCR